MNERDVIISALGEDYKASDDILINQLIDYLQIYREAYNDLKRDGKGKKLAYRKLVSQTADPTITPNGNERYVINNAFTAMNDCAKHIRQIIELLGLSRKGKKVEITVDKGNSSLLKIFNEVNDD